MPRAASCRKSTNTAPAAGTSTSRWSTWKGENLSDVIARRAACARARDRRDDPALWHFLEAAHSFETSIDGQPLRSLVHGDLEAPEHPRPRRRSDQGPRLRHREGAVAEPQGHAKRLRHVRVLVARMVRLGRQHRLATSTSGRLACCSTRWSRRAALRRTRHATAGTVNPIASAAVALVWPLPGRSAGDCFEAAGGLRCRIGTATRMRFVRISMSLKAGRLTEAEREGWPKIAHSLRKTSRRRGGLVPGCGAEHDEEATRRTASTPHSRADWRDRSRSGAVPVPLAAPARRARSATACGSLRRAAADCRSRSGPQRVSRRLARRRGSRRTCRRVSSTDWPRPGTSTTALEHGARSEHRRHRSASARWCGKATTLADRVIGNYRTPGADGQGAQWKMAREALAHAASVTPETRPVRASLRYCEGHLHRINGEARKARRSPPRRSTSSPTRSRRFAKPPSCDPNWPDPFLGLMRTFIYGLEDVDRGADALQQAQRLGYTPGDRETVQLADGYRARGDTFARTARTLTGDGAGAAVPDACRGGVSPGDRSLLDGALALATRREACARRSAVSGRWNSASPNSSGRQASPNRTRD